MKLSNTIQTVWVFMVRASKRRYLRIDLNELRVNLVPIENDLICTIERSKDIRFLVSKIILVGSKRGRPKKNDEELSYAA